MQRRSKLRFFGNQRTFHLDNVLSNFAGDAVEFLGNFLPEFSAHLQTVFSNQHADDVCSFDLRELLSSRWRCESDEAYVA